MGFEADVALDRVGPLRTPGLDWPSPARGRNISRLCGSSGATHAPLHLPSRYGTRSYPSARRKHTAFCSSCDRRNSKAAGLQSQYEIRYRV
jgi:hypothetical protein